MGERGVTGRVLGLAFDGTGYGADGHVWGFEFLDADLRGFERMAHLRYAPLPGGDKAARSPWRALLGYASLEGPLSPWALECFEGVSPTELTLARHQILRGVNAPLASSMGRLFDAAAAALGVRLEADYEGQAAMELESAAASHAGATLPFPVLEAEDGLPVFDPVPLLAALATQRALGAPIGELAASFHETLAHGVSRLSLDLCARRGLSRVALGGGCFQNARLLSSVKRRLEVSGVEVLTPRALGPNDGAVSYGQAVVAAARMIA
jgi:hydrogenase maturation protein HypF